MKIVKQGEIELTCTRCNTTFIVEAKDWNTSVTYGTIEYVPSFLPGMTKSRSGFYTHCPTCGKRIEVRNE